MVGWLKDDPLLDEWRAAVEDYRRICDIEAGVDYPTSEPDSAGEASKEMSFEIGGLYSRQQISDVLGGSIQAYLPFVDGRVVCGCFDPRVDMNPHAPEEVLFGEEYPTPVIDRTARMVFDQGQAGATIPVFLKRLSNQWEFVGHYLCIGFTQDRRVVERKLREHPSRGNFSGVLRFERV